MAGLLQILTIACGEADADDQIPAGVMDRAITLVDILDGWALGLHAEVACNGVGELARAVHRASEALGKPVRWKEVSPRLSKAQRKGTDAGAASAAMRALAEAGFGVIEEGSRGALAYHAIKPLPR